MATAGRHLSDTYPDNPFCDAFDKVDAAVTAKQAFETTRVKEIFHGPRGRADFEKARSSARRWPKPFPTRWCR
jgi:hypothetical protein